MYNKLNYNLEQRPYKRKRENIIVEKVKKFCNIAEYYL